LFHSVSSTPGGVGFACGYLYLNPGALLEMGAEFGGEFGGGDVCGAALADADDAPSVCEKEHGFG
jgi:hypothetical protein